MSPKRLVTFKSVYINIFGNDIVRPVSERRYPKMKTHQTLPWSNRFGFCHWSKLIWHVFCETVSI
jgi:hypothetical protein